jgi:hypothetical protein
MLQKPDRATLLLSVQRALLGVVPASLRAVFCELDGSRILLRFVFDGEIDPDDRENMQVVGTEVVADFPAVTLIEEEILRLDASADIGPYALAECAYRRRERDKKS